MHAAELAAERADVDDLIKIENALNAFEKEVDAGKQGVEEDLLFHLKIAEASKNSVLNSLLLIVIPDMIKLSKNLDICGDGRYKRAFEEHLEIFDCIKNHDKKGAGNAMKAHLNDLLTFSLEKKNKEKNKQIAYDKKVIINQKNRLVIAVTSLRLSSDSPFNFKQSNTLKV
eukprot:TRINITY_DN746_c1_g1_i1.p1 TRINITY_DN746_c1_g1~~TRINITY_DN746_c1_g1_i1.p1  ORF type:complete len:179 (-),score=15.43 TRINITY_DN746_c1_g1_i1:51-563(-)